MAPSSTLKMLTGKLQLLSRSSAHEGQGSLGAESSAFITSPSLDLERAFSRVKSVLLDTQMRQLYHDSKARAKQQLSELYTRARGGPQAPPEALLTQAQHQDLAPALDVPQAQLDAMYGSNGWLRSAVLSAIGHASQAFMQQVNSVNVVGAEHMRAALQRPAGQALITVCNHVASLDDPLVVASLVPADLLGQPDKLRWTLCASDRCFKYKALAPFFTAAKVLPVQRGGGLHQPGMVAAERRLQQGDWVQVFPEGTRSRDPAHMGRVRPGVGRLVAAAAASPDAPTPLVLPFAHAGMEHIMPVGSKLPSVGQQVHVVVGEPVHVSDLLQRAREEQWEQPRLYSAIAARVEEALQGLHAQARSSLAAATHSSTSSSLSSSTSLQASRAENAAAASTSGFAVEQQQGLRSNASMTTASAAAAAGRQQQVPLDYMYRKSSGGGAGWWGPAQARHWDKAAFFMWHSAWAERLAAAQATALHRASSAVPA